MGIEDDDVRRVRETADIVKLITGYTQLKKVGRRWSGLCPFHNEKTPSFSVNAEEGLYYCFGCQKSGDTISFVREIEHLDFVGAVEHLARSSGITLRYTNRNEGAARKKRTQLTDAVDKAVDWYHERLLSGPDSGSARKYLRARGFDGDLVRAYKIGWAPDGWDHLATALRVPPQVFTESGLGFVNRRGRLQDHFRGRVLFPIFDANGTAVGFGGRILPGAEGPKYKNSSESVIYAKSRLLYGLNWAKDEVVRENEVIICEGYTDVVGFAQAGMQRAVATCGTALTEEHVRMLSRFAKRVVLAFDADAAGQAAAERIYEWERAYEMDVAVAALPNGVDPADLAREDPEALKQAVEQAQPFMAFRLDRVFDASELGSVEGRTRAAERAVDVVREHPSDLVRDQYVMEVSSRTQVDPQRLRTLLAQPPRQSADEGRGRSNRSEPSYGHPPDEYMEDRAPVIDYRFTDSIETQMLRLAVHRPDQIPAYVTTDLFAVPIHQAAFRALLEAETLHAAISEAGPDVAVVLNQLAVAEEPDGEPGLLIGQLLHDAASRQVRRLQVGMSSAQAASNLAPLQRLIPEVRDANFDLAVAENLVPLLTSAQPTLVAGGSPAGADSQQGAL